MSPQAVSYESALLLTLGEITQLVVHSHDSAETLTNIVRLIQGRIRTAVCSVYVLEMESGLLVLGATVGLKPDAVGRVRMRLEEGLTGLVGQQLSPVMVADAFDHPRFKYFPEAGEDPYHSFLGVPLVEGGTLQGVLVVQDVERRTFSPSEVRMLVSVAAQVAPLVGDARLLERVTAMAHQADESEEKIPGEARPHTLTGVALSPGIGLGQAYVVDGFDEWRRSVSMFAADPVRERSRLGGAVLRARDELTRLSRHISELVGEDHGAILQAQLMIMQDRTIERDLNASLEGGASAEGALFATLDQYVAAFQRVATPFFQERVYDIKDVFHRLLWQLRPRPSRESSDKVVLIAREASVMELFAVDLAQLAGVVVEHGGPQSHAAILARSLNIPMVGQIADFAALQHPGRRLLIDGGKGVVTLDPADGVVVPTREPESFAAEPESVANATGSRGLPRVEVNINLLHEARPAVRLGATGVGLYRSEFLFLARRTLPTEDEQVTIYRKLLNLMEGRPVCIRTFDLRPDKLASVSHLGSTATRPYDWRLVLNSPPLQQLFREQVRAILRAAPDGPVRILVPLVSHTEVLEFVLETLGKVKDELSRSGLPFVAAVPVGAMIEVAAAVPLMPAWAASVDFFALGTNDLTASAMGIERDDPAAAGQLDPLHPGVLRLIADAASAAKQAGKPISVCGEMAADPLGALALAVFRIDAISVAVNQFAATKQSLSMARVDRLDDLGGSLLNQRSAKAVRALLST